MGRHIPAPWRTWQAAQASILAERDSTADNRPSAGADGQHHKKNKKTRSEGGITGEQAKPVLITCDDRFRQIAFKYVKGS
jgi:hypothetical protein